MKRTLYRMVLFNDVEECSIPDPIRIVGYCAEKHHDIICSVYSISFNEPPWPSDWDRIKEFDPNGVFIAEHVETKEVIGFIISFNRSNYGYISVVAVLPSYHRMGIGFALVKKAACYFKGLGIDKIKVDAYVDYEPALNLYSKIGFHIEKEFEDTEEK